VGDANRAEYITGFSERKLLLASLFFFFLAFSQTAPQIISSQLAITH
jgi:hypothetical protein